MKPDARQYDPVVTVLMALTPVLAVAALVAAIALGWIKA